MLDKYNHKLYEKLKNNQPIKIYELIYLTILALIYSIINPYYEWRINHLNRKIAKLNYKNKQLKARNKAKKKKQ